ncbi:OB-fold nucleic acid binding domain-containing protein [Cardiosporidium cionae]|uniref:OB-fold nucleic acid binding domain-containing protein n=1 Tax=Cardiosporidium cionae TaxID=476202 RepID=A0ABQ7J7T1_9APIC|nr:OB-fold nucleic acid binding domain-containing protein [Cardiosporidium cionae]|eukprot:KAF8820048.1 OB-fold nucleic acid binding domain-containing protein [Cardiosporidium cionae]
MDLTEDTSYYLPINNLRPFLTNWTIKARILKKSEKRQLKGEVQFFETELIDEAGTVISAKFWRDVAEKWFHQLEVGKVYTFCRGRVAMANHRYTTVPHPYDLTFSLDSMIQPLVDDETIEKERSHSFTPLRNIRNSKRTTPFFVNIIVVVHSVSPLSKILRKDGTEIARRNLRVVDDSGLAFTVTLWDTLAGNPQWNGIEKSVVGFIDLKVIDKQNYGLQGAFGINSLFIRSPTQTRAKELAKWYQTLDETSTFENMQGTTGSPLALHNDVTAATIANIKRLPEGLYSNRVRIARVLWRRKGEEEVYVYPACTKCSKKASFDSSDSTYKCEPCDLILDSVSWRYMLSASVVDHTGMLFVKIFDEGGANMFNKGAVELKSWDSTRRQEFLDYEMLFTEFDIIIRSKLSTYGGERQMTYILQNSKPVDFSASSTKMLRHLTELVSGTKNPRKSRGFKDEHEDTEMLVDENVSISENSFH